MSNNDKTKTKKVPFNRDAYAARDLTGLGWNAEDTNAIDTTVSPLGIVSNQSSSNFVSPEEQAKIKNYFQNPVEAAASDGPVQAATGFLASVFDYEDSQDNPVEWAWDGLWRSLGWGYDKINHGAAWAVSAAPAGIDTFSWDQANEISYGQAALAAGAANQEKYGVLGVIPNTFTSPFSELGGILARGDMAGPLGNEDFDVTNPEMRKAAFEESTVGRWSSGLTDAAFVVVADPLLFAGKIAKISKLKYLDDMFQGPDGVVRMEQQMAQSLGKPTSEIAPIARIARESTMVDPVTGKKVMSMATLMNRFKGTSGGTEYLVSALHSNTDELTAQLLIRYAAGDVKAGQQLLANNPAIGMEVLRRQRAEVRSVLDRSPEITQKLTTLTDRAIKRLNKKLDEPDFKKNSPKEYNNVVAARDRAQKTYDALYNNRLDELDDISDPRLMRLMSSEFKEIVAKDQILAKFILDEERSLLHGAPQAKEGVNLFAGGNYGFARNTALGRRIESSRLSRAEAAVASGGSRKAMVGAGEMVERIDDTGAVSQAEKMSRLRPWQVNEFNQGGFTRAVNIWRWFGEGNPSGWIATKGQNAFGSWKEMQAIINDVPIYSGQSRTVTTQVTDSAGNVRVISKEIGGTARGEELLETYIKAMSDSVLGDNAAALAVKKIENLIWDDISQWHGISKQAAEGLKQKAFSTRNTMIENFRNSSDTAFWVENGKLQKAPWIESQIQGGTYVPNFRKFNDLAKMHDESGLIKMFDTQQDFWGSNASNLYNAFNEVWRPSVLLRLGYLIRNNLEGEFRASAFAFSLDPIRFAAQQAAYAPRNAYVHYRFPGAVNAAESAVLLRKTNNGSTPMPKHFTKWLEREINARETNIEQIFEWIKMPGNLIDDVNLETKTFMEGFYKDVEDFYVGKLNRAKAAGAKSDELAGYQNNIDDAIANRDRLANITTFQRGGFEKVKENIENIRMKGNRPATPDYKAGLYDELVSENDELLTATIKTLENLKLMKIVLKDSIERRAILNDDISALSAYRQQGGAKLRVMNGTIQSPDGTILAQAFNKDNPLLSVILSNLSADATTKAISVSASNTARNAFIVHAQKNYIEVVPESPQYFNGVASALRQISFSEIGKMAIDGKDVNYIANYLMKNGEGQQIRDFIVGGWNKVLKEGDVYKNTNTGKSAMLYRGSEEDALQIAEDVIARYRTIAPSPELQQYMKTFVSGPKDDLNNVVKGFLSQKTSTGQNLYDLKPVIGNISEELGAAHIRDTVQRATSLGMKWLGTYPEDALTRGPFYGMRYEKTLMEMVGTQQAAIGENAKISMSAYNNMRTQAHARALQDTKQWMFTIERRTNLGTYGEVAIPFISAMQNSITTVGRLIWRDPSIAVLMTRLWQVPDKAGMTDENGNIVIPIPHDWLPDGVEQALGLQNMLNWKIGMNQLNLIAQQLDTGMLFQAGPVVAVPAAEFVRRGWFGITPDTPGIFTSIMGKENADSLWGLMKAHTFGAYRGEKGELQIASPPSAMEAVLPSGIKRIFQLWQKDGNETWARNYNANYHTEYMKWRGNLRATPPTKEEVTNMTNNLTILGIITAYTSAFPPRYETTLQPLVDDYRSMLNTAETKDDAVRLFTEKYGTDFLSSSTLGMSTNLTGIGNNPVKDALSGTVGVISQAVKYSDLVSKISPTLSSGNSLDSLSILFTSNVNDIYDGTVTAWQEANAVPGLSELYRSKLSPEEAFQKDSKTAGWSKWLSAKAQFDARLAQMRLTSYAQSPALEQEKNAFLIQMSNDPMYQGWFIDYNDFGSQRTEGTVLTMKAALSDPVFVSDHLDDPIWQAASEYLKGRAQVESVLAAQGGGEITSLKNMNIAQWWNQFRSNLKNVPGWDVFANRYLDGDDDPTNTGVSIGTIMSGAA